MTSGTIVKINLEDGYDEEEEDIESIMEVSDIGGCARGSEGEVDEERTPVKFKAKKKPYMPKTPDENTATMPAIWLQAKL